MSNLLIKAAASGERRSAHYVIPNGKTLPERTLLIERASTNRCLHSADLANAAWTKSLLAISSNARTAPDGTMTADLATLDGGAPSTARQTITVSGDGTKVVSMAIHYHNNPLCGFQWRDSTAAVTRQLMAWQFNGLSAPTVSYIATAAADAFTPQSLGDGWWWVSVKVPGVLAANTNLLELLPAYAGASTGDGSYVWGVQVEDFTAPTSYIPTTSAAVTRNEDLLYLPFTAKPQPLTVYMRFIELGTGLSGLTRGIFSLGESNTDSLFVLNDSANFYRVYHRRNTTDVIGGPPATQTAYGDLVEVRVTLTAAGVTQIHQTINGGAEESGTASSAQALPVDWDVPRMYIGSRGASSADAAAFTHVAVLAGLHSRETMRQHAGVR